VSGLDAAVSTPYHRTGQAANADEEGQAPMRATEFDDPDFLARLRTGEAAAYRLLVRRFHSSLVRFAATIIGSHAHAEEVVQDSWVAVCAGVGRFEARSSLVTWIFAIVANRSRTRASHEGRLVGLGALLEGTPPGGRGVPLTEFRPDGHWAETPRLWDEISPERVVGGRQLWDHVQAIVDLLPAGQRAVILLRDMEGCDAEEVCSLLAISAENQRVLLHRARSRIRREIDRLTGEGAPARATPVRVEARRGSRGSGGLSDGVAGRVACMVHGLAKLARFSRLATMVRIAAR
jgi:RNA polymerase sigma-70 factor (ECF subfamily)